MLPKQSYGFVAVCFSLLLHGVMVAALFFSWQNQPKIKDAYTPKFIQASLVELEAKTKPKPKPQSTPEQKPTPPKPKQDEQKRKQLEKESKAAAEKKRKTEEKKKREAEAKKKAAAEKRKKEEAERLEQQRQQEFEQKRLQEQLAEEERQLMLEEYALEAQSISGSMAARVENNWYQPPSARKGMICVLEVKLLPNGTVVDVKIASSSGSEPFDRSAVQAVKRIERFPEVKGMPIEAFDASFRPWILKFNPQNLRL